MAMQVHDVEQNSPEWDQLRAGLPTASEMKNVVTSKGKLSTGFTGYAAVLAAETYVGGPVHEFSTAWTERGHALEPDGISQYEWETNAQVIRVGFITNHDAGCSPDGDVKGEDKLVEIKCLSGRHHVMNLSRMQNGHCPADYFTQVQGQMWIAERSQCDLYLYHPELPSGLVTVARDDAFIKTLAEQVTNLIAKRDEFVQVLESWS